MKKNFTFEIESLLTGIENSRGPIDQMLFANRFAEHEGWITFSYLARVTFAEPTINKAFPGAVPLDETLLIARHGRHGIELHLCVRSGRSCLRIATGYLPDREVTVHNEYRHEILPQKLIKKESKRFSTMCGIMRRSFTQSRGDWKIDPLQDLWNQINTLKLYRYDYDI